MFTLFRTVVIHLVKSNVKTIPLCCPLSLMLFTKLNYVFPRSVFSSRYRFRTPLFEHDVFFVLCLQPLSVFRQEVSMFLAETPVAFSRIIKPLVEMHSKRFSKRRTPVRTVVRVHWRTTTEKFLLDSGMFSEMMIGNRFSDWKRAACHVGRWLAMHDYLKHKRPLLILALINKPVSWT